MTDYRTLSEEEKKDVDRIIIDSVDYGLHTNKNNGFTWMEPDYTFQQVHGGNYCAICLAASHNCLCSHEN